MSNNNTNTTRPYLAATVAKTVKNVPYALQLEGYVAGTPYFKEATTDKKAFLSVSIGIRGSAARLMARADGTFDKEKTYGKLGEDGREIDEFADLHFFGQLAETMSKALVKGRRVIVSGPMKWEPFKRKDGSDAQKLVIDVDNAIDGGSRKNGVDPTIGNRIAVVTTTYTGKDGLIHNVPMAGTLSGTVIGCNGLKTGGSGTTYLSFGIKTNLPAEKVHDMVNGIDGKNKAYDEKRTIVNATVFGQDAERMAKVIADGAIVVVSGPVESREYDGKVSYQNRPRCTTILKYAEATAPAGGEAASAGTAAADAAELSGEFFAPMDDADDELPF